MARLTDSQRETFEALRRAYLAEVPARIAAIREAAAEAEAGQRGTSRAGLEELRHLVHQLVGSSAIFGLHALCAAARALEDLVKRLLEGAASGAADLDLLTATLEATWKESATPGSREPKG